MAGDKNKDAVEGSDAVDLAGMSEDRFKQYLRLECLKLAEVNGRIHGKATAVLPADAELLFGYVTTGKSKG